MPWTVAAVAVLAAGVLAWLQLRPAAPTTPHVVTRTRWDLKDLSGFVNVSRDGRRLVYTVSTGQAGFSLVTRELDQFAAKPIAGTEGALFPLLSPDGEWIIYWTAEGNRIKKVPFGGGASIGLCTGTLGNGAAWGEDDSIVFGGPKGLMRVAASGGTPEALTTLDAGKNEVAHTRPQFLPGGKSLLFTIKTTGADGGQRFAVLDLQTRAYRVVAPGGDNGRYAGTGHLTYLNDATVFALPFDLDRLTPVGGAAPVIDAVSTVGPLGTADYSFSDNGMLIYSENATQGTTLAWANRQGAIQVIPGQAARVWGTGRLSPNGQQVANGIHGDKDSDIWVADLPRATVNRLTFGGENDNPIWTADGRHIIFSGSTNGKPGLYWVPADGSTRAQLLLGDDGGALAGSTTPDGKTLYYSHVVDSRRRIMTVGMTPTGISGSPQPLHDAPGSEGEPLVSPDGRWVAFTSAETGTAEIYVLPIPASGGKVRISPQGGRNARWARSGRELLYWSSSLGTATLFAVPMQASPALQVGAAVKLFDFASGTTWDTTPEPDKFLIEVSKTAGGSTFVLVTNWFDELRRRAPAKK